MKKQIIKIGIFAGILAVFGCGKDNYDPPQAQLTGKVAYNGQAIGVRGSNQSVYLQLWQDGFELSKSFNVYVTQDGSFSAELFNGTYKLVSTSGNGPWVSKQDTVVIQVNGNTTVDYPVTPYYTVSNVSYNLNGGTLTASFDITGVDESRAIEYVTLMVNDTKFVDIGQHINSVEKAGVSAGHVELSLDVTDNLATSKALFTRVGVKINGVTEGVYDTQVEQLK